MTSFSSVEVSVANTTAVKVVDAADFDREIWINDSTAANMRVAFTSAAASTGVKISKLVVAVSGVTARFVAPAGQELWVWQDSGNSATASVFVTARGSGVK